jgi:glucosyl-dolichyl phosphate glucuronosyltransferase
VIVAAYTLDRWECLVRCVNSLQDHTHDPDKIVLSIDHNEELFTKCEHEWEAKKARIPVRVIRSGEHTAPDRVRTSSQRVNSGRPHGGGGTRHAGALVASSEVLVFIDDDAWAEPTWLAAMLAPYQDPGVVAVGGRPLPEFEGDRPKWFPESFDWIFGCDYDGLPQQLGPTTRLIGASLSVRADVFRLIGGFATVDLDDLYMCMRLAHQYASSAVLYEPRAVVHHYVPVRRTTWQYFCRRSFYVNRDKVRTFDALGEAASLGPEINFVRLMLFQQTSKHLRQLAHGDGVAVLKLGAMYCAVALAGLGHVTGVVQLRLARWSRSQPPESGAVT